MRILCRAMIVLLAVASPLSLKADDSPVSFHREVLPLLRTNCVVCHKPGKLKGGLDLTTHVGLMAGGVSGSIVEAGDADGSRLIEVLVGDEPEMPQDGEPLLPQQIELLRRWIQQGALVDEPSGTVALRPAEPPVYDALPAVRALAFSPDGKLLAVAGRHEILLYHADGSGLAARLLGDSPRLESIAFSRDGTLLVSSGGAVSEFGEVQIWNVEERTLIRSIKASHDVFFGVSLSPDNQQVAVGCADKLVRVFRVSDGAEVMRCDNHLDWVFGSAFTNDGKRLATVSRDKAAKLIDIATGHLIDDINRTRDPLICLVRHPVEDQIAIGGTDGTIRLFRMEPRGGRLSEGDHKEESFVRELESMGSPVQAIAFSPDGSAIAGGVASGELRIFRAENGQRIAQIRADHGPIFALAFTADGQQLVSGSFDGVLRWYNATSGEPIKESASVPVRAQ